MTRPGKRVALAIGLLGVVVGVVAVCMLAPVLREKWYLWRLEVGDEATRRFAASKLADIGSTVAIPALIEKAASPIGDAMTKNPDAFAAMAQHFESMVGQLTQLQHRLADLESKSQGDRTVDRTTLQLQVSSEGNRVAAVRQRCDKVLEEVVPDSEFLDALRSIVANVEDAAMVSKPLFDHLKDDRWIHRLLSGQLLRELGRRDSISMDSLETLETDVNPHVRYAVRRALEEAQQ